MLPSRSLRAGVPAGLRRSVQSRQFSAKPSLPQAHCTSPLTRSSPFSSQRPAWQQVYRRASPNQASEKPSQARFISSSTSTETGPYNTPLPSADTFASPTSYTQSPLDGELLRDTFGGSSPPDVWYSGYLKELGLDFGWGTSSMVEFLFENLHIISGFSIGGSIIASAAIIRLCTFPLIIASSNNGAKLSALRDVTEPIQARMRAASKKQDQMELQLCRQDMRKVYQSANIQLWKTFLPMVQIPIGFGFWRVTRNMADLPVPGMESGGFLWFENLIWPDPYFVLPLLTGLLQHLAIRFGGDATMNAASQGLRKLMMYGLPILSVGFTSFAPAAVQLSFTVAAGFSIMTNLLLRQPAFRAFFKLAPRVKHTPKPTSPVSPYKGTITVAGRAKAQGLYTPASASVRSASSTAGAADAGAKSKFSITQPISDAWKSINDYVGEVMPEAKGKANANLSKAMSKKANDYEKMRKAAIEKDKWQWEDAQKAEMAAKRRRR